MTKSLLFRSLIIGLLAGASIAFVNSVLWVRPAIGYDPPLTQAEYERLSGLTVAKMEALLKSREVRVTRKQVLAESMRGSFFWKNLAKNSLVPSLGVFLACLCIGVLERRYTRPEIEAANRLSLAAPVRNVNTTPQRILTDAELKDRQDVMDAVCAILAFFPWLVNAICIHADIAIGMGWQAFVNPISLSALLWLSVTYFHYRSTRTNRAAWLFALFPVAFSAPGFFVYLWISSTHSR
jgi:hypothetical protein